MEQSLFSDTFCAHPDSVSSTLLQFATRQSSGPFSRGSLASILLIPSCCLQFSITLSFRTRWSESCRTGNPIILAAWPRLLRAKSDLAFTHKFYSMPNIGNYAAACHVTRAASVAPYARPYVHRIRPVQCKMSQHQAAPTCTILTHSNDNLRCLVGGSSLVFRHPSAASSSSCSWSVSS